MLKILFIVMMLILYICIDYNRPRPDDDAFPEVLSDYLGLIYIKLKPLMKLSQQVVIL